MEPWTYLKFPYLKKVGWKGFVDGEDSGVEGDHETYALGSRRFVGDNPGYRPSFAVILDMVGGD